MAALANPTWTEVQAMDPTERAAFNVVKGEQNGDVFLWDKEWWDAEGKPQKGGWKSQLEGKTSN